MLASVVVGYYALLRVSTGSHRGKAFVQVVSADGTRGLGAEMLRTLMRLIDFLPVLYAVGAISIVVSSKNQRLGDLVAGTVVIRSRSRASQPASVARGERRGWDTATITREEVALVRRFVERRNELTPEARRRLASELAAKLRPRVDGGSELDDERFLIQLLAEKDA